MGVVEKFYMVDVLTVYRTYLPKNFKCTFRFAKIILKNLLASFLWTQSVTHLQVVKYLFTSHGTMMSYHSRLILIHLT